MKIKDMVLTGIILLVILSALVYLSTNVRSQRDSVKVADNIASGTLVTKVEEGKENNLTKELPAVSVVNKEVREKGIEELIGGLENPDWPTAQAAAEKLARLGKATVPNLISALQGASVGLKGQIVFLLGRIGDKETVPILMETLKDENAYIRANAADALGKIKDSQALPALTTGLFDDDVVVKTNSAMALGELKDPQAVEDLINRMIDEKDERMKSAVAETFGKLKDKRATGTLLKELKSENDQLYKNKVVFSLGEIGDPSALEGLKEHLANLRKYSPTEPMVKFQWEEAIKIAEEAIQKIEKRQ